MIVLQRRLLNNIRAIARTRMQ